MHPLLQANQNDISALCRRYGVAKLEVFGSANTTDFDDQCSDFDFLVEFGDGGDMFLRFMEFANELEQLLGRPVDLVSEERLRPHFLESIAATRKEIYASKDGTVAA